MAVLIASDLRKDIAGAPLLRGVSFKLERRERLTIAGRNGAGKTTLLRMLAGETSVDGGELVFEKNAKVALHDQRPPRERGLTLREIRVRHWFRVARKELLAGALNGTAVALVTAAGVLVWSRSFGLATVIGASMVCSMIIAGIAGASVPIALVLLKQDPAAASSIVLTTVTDVMGFLTFLGFATLAVRML